MADFQLQIYTQEKKVFEGRIESLVVPAEDGYLGVLANHAPLLTTLGEGRLTYRTSKDSTEIGIRGGFLEVHANQAVVLADSLT